MKKFPGLFFWQKKPQLPKIDEYMVAIIKYLPQLRKLLRNDLQESDDGRLLGIMYDFYAEFQTTQMDGDIGNIPLLPGQTHAILPPTSQRIEMKPVLVQGELETFPTPFSLDKLEEKILLFKSKSKLIQQRYTKEQCDGFVKRLENRKRYTEQQHFFEQFPNTSDEKIDALLGKYKLEMNKSDLFIPVFPKAAIDIMTEYQRVALLITDERPVFYVIAEEKDFQEKRKRLDPILLVQSPFGFYWQVLGAWDKEMLLLSEL